MIYFDKVNVYLKFVFPFLVVVLFSSGCAVNKDLQPSAPASVAPTENNSKILMRSTGMPMHVDYSVGASDLECKELKDVGAVRDKGEKILLPWIVKLTEKLDQTPDQIETFVPAREPVQVSGISRWVDRSSTGHCGPVNVSFLPAEKHTYLVEFVLMGTSKCTSQVFDVTDSAKRVAVPVEFKTCPRSFLDIWLGR